MTRNSEVQVWFQTRQTFENEDVSTQLLLRLSNVPNREDPRHAQVQMLVLVSSNRIRPIPFQAGRSSGQYRDDLGISAGRESECASRRPGDADPNKSSHHSE